MCLNLSDTIFSIQNSEEFEKTAVQIFKYQATSNIVYNKYLQFLKTDIQAVKTINEIPFLPISFFKTHKIVSGNSDVLAVFTSSGTTGQTNSKHYISDISIYKDSFNKCFSIFYGNIKDYCILALLPSYLERAGSSLVYMTEEFIKESYNPDSGFFLNEFDVLANIIISNEQRQQKTILIGVSYALLQFSEQFPIALNNTIVMETGGMKGRYKEITKEELHTLLKKRFKISHIHSEYGMTELLSQAYSKGNGQFFCPPWMKVLIRDVNDPFCYLETLKTGGINIIDLANINSCSFIETNDLGKKYNNDSFEVLGRYDNSDIRGCNLLVAE